MFKNIFSHFIELSKKIAFSLLNEKEPTDLYESDFFNDNDKAHIYKNITSKDLISKRNDISNKINVDEDWKNIKRKINIPTQKVTHWWYSIAGAAAVLVGVLFTWSDLFVTEASIVPIADTKVKVKKKDFIAMGSNKATLTLEDGSNIQLVKGENINTNSVSSNGDKLVYKKSIQKEIKYNYLTIPRGGQYFIELSDGSEIWLNSESQLKFPVSFIKGRTREVELVYGEAYFTISPSTKHDGDTFKVLNRGQEVDVLGTEFNIKSYKDESIVYTTLVEGKVAVKTKANSKQYLLPSQQAVLNIKSNNIQIKEVDIDNVVSWKNGVFSFKDKNLKEIMKVISRWYDVDVIFKNKSLEKIKFKGVLGKDQEIDEILFSIKTLSVINDYSINGKTIILN